MDSPEWVSSMDLQTPTPAGTGSGKLEDWKNGRLEDWIWKTGRLEDWITRGLDDWLLGLRLYIVHATVPSGTVADEFPIGA